MLTRELPSISAHMLHVSERMRVRALSDLTSLNNNQLPERFLQKAGERLDNNSRIALIDGGMNVVIINEIPIKLNEDDNNDHVIRMIPGLSEIVKDSVGEYDGEPDFAAWISKPGRVSLNKLGKVTEAIVWEMVSRDESNVDLTSKYSMALMNLADRLVDQVSSERTEAGAAWKYAIACAALSTMKPKAGTDIGIVTWTSGADRFTAKDDGWVDNGSLMGYNPRAQRAIMDEVRRVDGMPDSNFMEDIITTMSPLPKFAWLED